MKPTIVITGTSSGVGFSSALLFARQDYEVYATMRNLSKSEELQTLAQQENLDIKFVQLDVTIPDSVQTAIDEIITRSGKIDILLNNAGAGFAKTIEQSSLEEIKWVTDVNYLGVVYCVQAVLPHMRERKSGHIINVTSVGGLVGQPFNELYCGAKFAVEGFTETLATYITPFFNVKFSLVEPGGIQTEFLKSAASKTMVEGQFATGDYKPIFERYISGSQKRSNNPDSNIYQTPEQVADVILEVAQSENPPLRKRTSSWAERFTSLKTQADPDGLKLANEVTQNFL